MVDARHKAQTIAEGLHSPISFEYANEAARLAAGPFESYDKNKFALQLDTNQIYVLTGTAPIVWGSVSGPGISGDLDMDGYDIVDVGTVDGVDVSSHAGRHESGGADAIEIADLGTSEVNVLLVLQPDGVGGVVWSVPLGGGDVVGPAGATDNAIALFDAGTGKVIKNSLVTIDGSGNISTPGMVDGYALGSEFYDINAQLNILGGILGGDLSGTLPNPTVVDLSIVGEEQGSVLYFNGTNWVQLSPGEDGYALITHDTGANPTWGEVASSSPITSVFGRVGDVIAGIDDYSASQIDNDSTVSGEQVSDALEYLDGYISSHAGNLNNPHQTSIGNIVQGTLAELNLAISDATLDDISGTRTPTSHATSHEEGESDAIDGYQIGINYVPVNYVAPINPIIGEHIAAIDDALASSGLVDSVFGRIGNVIAAIDDYSASQIDNNSTVTGEQVSDALEYLDGYISGHVGDINNPHQTSVGNIGSGTLAELNLAISDATLDDISGTRTPTAHATSHEEGESDAIDGYQVQLNYVPVNYVAPVNPIIGEHIAAIDDALALSGLVDSVFGRVGDVIASIDDYSASQIDNDSTVTGGQVSDALEYLDGYIKDHSYSHENGGGDEIEISNLGTSELNNTLVLMPDGIGGVVWSVAGGGGDVVGPAGATNNAIALFDAGTGKVIKNSLVTIDGSGNISTPGTVDGYSLSTEFYDINVQLDILGGTLGGDLSGTLPNPSVVDLTISGEEQGSVLYFDGSNWVQLPPGEDGYALITHDTGANPTWGEVAATAPVTSVFSRVGDVIAGIDDYSAAQIDNDSTVIGEQVSDALEYLDGYIGGHIVDVNNPHQTSVGNIVQGTLAELNLAISDATLDDISGTRTPTAHAISHEEGEPDAIDGYQIGIAYVPVNYATPINPIIGEHIAAIDGALASSGLVDSVFGRVGNVVAAVDDYSASQIDNDSTVPGEQVSDALEYLDGYIGGHVVDLNNPHQTNLGNIGSGTLAELNLAISDATLDDVSGTRIPTAHATSHEEGESDAIDGYQIGIVYVPVNYTAPVNPIIGEHIAAIDEALASSGLVDSVFGRVGDVIAATDDYSASQIDNDSTVTGEQVSDALEYLDGYIGDVYTLPVGGDLSGFLPNPEVTDLSISGEEQGSVLYFNGSNWAQLSPGEDGYVLTTHDTGANPTWGAVSGSSAVDSVFGRVGDIVATTDDYSASQIDNDSIVTGEQVSDALEYLDGYIGDVYTLPVGGDLSGTLPNPTVIDLTITSEEQGSILYFDGANWVQLPPGSDGYALITHDTGANPTWEEAGGSGNVVGPSVATDNAIVRYDGITGKLIQNSGVLIDNLDNISGAESLAIGDVPAQTGAVRLTNNEGIYWAGITEIDFPGNRQWKFALTIPSENILGDIVNDGLFRKTHVDLPDAFLTLNGAQAPQNGGADIAASLDELGLTRIPCYVVRCDLDATPANSRVHIWFRRQDVSNVSDTVIWLWWGDALATPPAVDANYGRNDVFDGTTGTGAPFAGFAVWLFDEDPTDPPPAYKDHTGNGHHLRADGILSRGDAMDVRGVVSGGGRPEGDFSWSPGTGDFTVLWAAAVSEGYNTYVNSSATDLRITSELAFISHDGAYYDVIGPSLSPAVVCFSRDGDNLYKTCTEYSGTSSGVAAVSFSWASEIQFSDSGLTTRTFAAFVDTALNPYWLRAFHNCLVSESTFWEVGTIEAASPTVENVRGIIVDANNDVLVGDADNSLVLEASDYISNKVDGYEVLAVYDGYVDVVNNDIRSIKTATFNEWPTLTPDEDGYVTVDFGSYQKATIDLNDEASVTITLNEPIGPGNFMLILKQGLATATTSLTWITEGSHGLYGPYGNISYSQVLGLVTMIGLAYDGSDWFGTSSQPLEQILGA